MAQKNKNRRPLAEEAPPLKKRRLGSSKHRFVEVGPREVADAEIAKLFEDSNLFLEEE